MLYSHQSRRYKWTPITAYDLMSGMHRKAEIIESAPWLDDEIVALLKDLLKECKVLVPLLLDILNEKPASSRMVQLKEELSRTTTILSEVEIYMHAYKFVFNCLVYVQMVHNSE